MLARPNLAAGRRYPNRLSTCYRFRMAIEIGQPAPAFSLRNKKREEVTRDSYPGKHLVLAFYPLAFTGG